MAKYNFWTRKIDLDQCAPRIFVEIDPLEFSHCRPHDECRQVLTCLNMLRHVQIGSITWIQCTSWDWNNLIFYREPFPKNKLFWYKIFKNILALFVMLLLTPFEPILVDYVLINQRLNFHKKCNLNEFRNDTNFDF